MSLGTPVNVLLRYDTLGGNVIIGPQGSQSPYRLDVHGTANVGGFTATSITSDTLIQVIPLLVVK